MIDTLSTGDRVQLLELYGRSVMLLELGRCEEWAELFLPTATYRCMRSAPESGLEQFGGRAQLLDLARRIKLAQFDLVLGNIRPPLRYRHHLTNIALFADGDRAAAGYAHLTVTNITGPEPPHPIASGLYTDRLFKCPTGWFFETRAFTADTPTSPSNKAPSPTPPEIS